VLALEKARKMRKTGKVAFMLPTILCRRLTSTNAHLPRFQVIPQLKNHTGQFRKRILTQTKPIRPILFVGKGTPTESEQAFIDYIFSEAEIEV
jgi:hypothetical protein